MPIDPLNLTPAQIAWIEARDRVEDARRAAARQSVALYTAGALSVDDLRLALAEVVDDHPFAEEACPDDGEEYNAWHAAVHEAATAPWRAMFESGRISFDEAEDEIARAGMRYPRHGQGLLSLEALRTELGWLAPQHPLLREEATTA